MALSFAEDRPVACPPAAARLRIIGGSAKPPEPWGFSKILPGFQKFFKSLLCQNSQISLNLRSEVVGAAGYLQVGASRLV